MITITEIESIIREIIKNNESIVTNYDSKLLCNDFENTKEKLNELYKNKKELNEKLQNSINEFFELKQNPLLKKFNINSFSFMPSLLGGEYKFFLPKNVNKFSKKYFCYITMMDKLEKEYDSIIKLNGEYFILDISSSINLEKMFKNDLN